VKGIAIADYPVSPHIFLVPLKIGGAARVEQVSYPELEAVVERILSEPGRSIMPTIAEVLQQEARQQGLQQGLQEGLQQGLQQARENVLDVLKARFGEVPQALVERMDAVADLASLKVLDRRAIIAESLTAFAQTLELPLD